MKIDDQELFGLKNREEKRLERKKEKNRTGTQ